MAHGHFISAIVDRYSIGSVRSLVLAASLLLPPLASAVEIAHSVPMTQSGSGGMYVDARLGDVDVSLLLDTGAGMLTITPGVLRSLQRSAVAESPVKVRRVAARMADGRLKPMDVYRISSFRIGDSCDLGPVEAAVLEGQGVNLLGIGALSRAAPFGINLSPPALYLSGCDALAAQ